MRTHQPSRQVPAVHLVVLGVLALLFAALGAAVVAVPWWLTASLVLVGEVSLAFMALRVVERRLSDHHR